MFRLLSYLKQCKKSVLAIVLLLIVQAYCDLALPQYTSDIIDTGIQNGGVSHCMPQAVTKEEFELAKVFMTEDEVAIWEDSYREDGDVYRLDVTDEKKLDEYDDEFVTAFILNNQTSAVEESAFKQQIAAQSGQDPLQLENVPVEMLGQQMGIELSTFKKEIEDVDGNVVLADCVDMRPVFQMMLAQGRMTTDDIVSMRDTLQEKMESMGSSLILSMGISYAKNMDSAAGVDMDKLQTDYLWASGIKMVMMALLVAVITVCVGMLASRVAAGAGRDLRGSVYKKVMGFSSAEMDRFSTASLITRTTNDVQQIQMVIVLLLRMVLYAPVLGIGGVIKVWQTGAGMGWVIGLAVAAIMALVLFLMVVAMPKFKLMQKLVDGVNLVSREILTGLSVIRAFGREKKEEERFDKANMDLMKTNLFVNRAMTFMMPTMMLIMNGLTVLIVYVGASNIDAGKMQVGDLMAFIQYAMQIIMAFLFISMVSIMMPRAQVAAERVNEILDMEVMIKDPEEPKEFLPEKKGEVEFKNVYFCYPDADEAVLHNISFTAPAGKTTAFIGSTGSGKSTLINLIPRFFDVSRGSILVDGVDIRDVKQHDLCEKIGYVPQKGVLFSGTIESNLKYGKEDATIDEVKRAARIAQATDFIEEKEEKYDSPIAQGGSNVSGGQKQRLSIARAIAKDPEIYIFDDSFSALDYKTDVKLRSELQKETNGSTTLIVAQRISTILHADQIIVLDEGNIVGKGTHEELLNTCPVYQQIAKSQLSEDDLKKAREVSDHE